MGHFLILQIAFDVISRISNLFRPLTFLDVKIHITCSLYIYIWISGHLQHIQIKINIKWYTKNSAKCGEITANWHIIRISLLTCFPFSYICNRIIKCIFGSFYYILKLSAHWNTLERKTLDRVFLSCYFCKLILWS